MSPARSQRRFVRGARISRTALLGSELAQVEVAGAKALRCLRRVPQRRGAFQPCVGFIETAQPQVGIPEIVEQVPLLQAKRPVCRIFRELQRLLVRALRFGPATLEHHYVAHARAADHLAAEVTRIAGELDAAVVKGDRVVKFTQRKHNPAQPAEGDDLRCLFGEGQGEHQRRVVALAGATHPAHCLVVLAERQQVVGSLLVVTGKIAAEHGAQPIVQQRNVLPERRLRVRQRRLDVLGSENALVYRGIAARAIPRLSRIRHGRPDHGQAQRFQLVHYGQELKQLLDGSL